MSTKTASWVPLVHVHQSVPCFNCNIVFAWVDSRQDGEFKQSGDCHLRSTAIETRKTQLPRVSNQAGCIDKSHWRCRPNKYEAKYSSCVCHVTRHAQKVCDTHHVTPKVYYIGHVTSPSVLYWSCDSPNCAILVMWPKKVCFMENIKQFLLYVATVLLILWSEFIKFWLEYQK